MHSATNLERASRLKPLLQRSGSASPFVALDDGRPVCDAPLMASPRPARASTRNRPTVHVTLCTVAVLASGACSLFTDLSGLSGGTSGATTSDAGDAGTDATAPPDAEAGTPCVDTRSDPLHCGRCGHSCLGDPCDAGACVPTPVASTPMGIGGIDVDDTRVYWSSYMGDGSGKLLAVDKGLGGSPTVLIDSPDSRLLPEAAPRAVRLSTRWTSQQPLA